MSDLAARLRAIAASEYVRGWVVVKWAEPNGLPDWTPVASSTSLADIITKAADALDSLSAENARLREALQSARNEPVKERPELGKAKVEHGAAEEPLDDEI